MAKIGEDEPRFAHMSEETRRSDCDEWRRYQLSLSMPERKELAEALRNSRMTKHFVLNEAPKYDHDPLSELEASNHLRSLINQVSQIEHFSFETWREVRRIKLVSYIAIALGVALALVSLCLLLVLIV
jgi:hypothetical protein